MSSSLFASWLSQPTARVSERASEARPRVSTVDVSSRAMPGVHQEYVVQRRRRLGSVGGSVDGGRRSSRDADTLTDEDPLLQLNGGDPAPAGSVEEIVEENPFAGGSLKTTCLDRSRP